MEDNSIAIKLNVQRALAQYYALPLNLVRADPTIEVVGNRRFLTRFDATTGVTVGVDAMLFEATEARALQIAVLRLQERQDQEADVPETESIYPDGLLLRLDDKWSEVSMQLEPFDRVY